MRAFASERGLPLVGGSDAHLPMEVGRTVTRVDAPSMDPAAIVASIRDGAVEPLVQRGSIDSALRAAYALYHRANGSVAPPEYR